MAAGSPGGVATALAPRRARSRGPSVQCARGAGAPAWKEVGGGHSPQAPPEAAQQKQEKETV